ncbi:hypothetical protein CASFOL_029874 [Castilleja foliolosa]|uniref:Epidermal patterning factor-like protein n=1 Tax=Castilleja foliolosa TaxID=1961234 RepID=A0ABD3C928_9LAMI
MGGYCHRQLTLSAAIAFLLLASVSAFDFNPARQFSVGVRKIREEVVERLITARRRLGGPGSSPPSCISKCGRCGPCKPVHVPVQPGMSMPLEYYPEAWRCKCGNKLFMP